MAVVDLNATQAGKFLELLAEEPFVCVVVVDDGLHLFSKGMDDEQVAKIKEQLVDIEGD
jgi:hypothetical protein